MGVVCDETRDENGRSSSKDMRRDKAFSVIFILVFITGILDAVADHEANLFIDE